MDRLELQKLRDLPIEGVAERLGLRVRMHKALCPFHDDHHASMSFKVSKNTCRCFVCMTQSIGPIDLVMRHLNLDFKAACRWLADENNIILEEWKPQTSAISHQTSFDASRYARYFDHPFLNEPARKFLFDERRLKQGTPWLQIPYYDRSGRLTGVQNRNLGLTPIPSPKGDGSLTLQGEVGGGAPRFRFPSGSKCGIYNLPVLNLLKPGEPLFITEGSSDCWAMLSAGHKAIAIPSATLLTRQDIEMLSSLPSQPGGDGGGFHMFPDRDAPGERLFLQLQKVLPTLQHHQLPPDCKDFSDYYLTHLRKPP